MKHVVERASFEIKMVLTDKGNLSLIAPHGSVSESLVAGIRSTKDARHMASIIA